MKVVKGACIAATPSLSDSGEPQQCRARLCVLDFVPAGLAAYDLAEFYTLTGKYVEMEFEAEAGTFEDHRWYLGWVEAQAGHQLKLQWEDGQTEWIDDLNYTDDYRIVAPSVERVRTRAVPPQLDFGRLFLRDCM